MRIFALNPDISIYEKQEDNRGKIISVHIGSDIPTISNFRCISCGRIAFQYAGGVEAIYVGAKEIEEPIIDIQCHLCKVKYRLY